MQVLITSSTLRSPIVLRFTPISLSLIVLACMVPIWLVGIIFYHNLLASSLTSETPFSFLSKNLGMIEYKEVLQKDRFIRENLDAMASKVGDLQARLVRMELVSERVASLAGMKPEEFKSIEPPAQSSSGLGGALPALRSAFNDSKYETLARNADILNLLDELNQLSNKNADVLTLIESRLNENRLASLMIPSNYPVDGPIGSGFGFRTDPFTGIAALHTGLDFPAPFGKPIVASAGGVVLTANTHLRYGQMVEIDHGNGLVTRYAHASRLLVKPGDLVKRGQIIAQVGSTGRSTGPHLHFEVMVGGVQQNPIKFLSGHSNTLNHATASQP